MTNEFFKIFHWIYAWNIDWCFIFIDICVSGLWILDRMKKLQETKGAKK